MPCRADLIVTIFWRFGLDPAAEDHDTTERPHRISDGRPIRNLFAFARHEIGLEVNDRGT